MADAASTALVAALSRLADVVPNGDLGNVARTLECISGPSAAGARAQVVGALAHPRYRERAGELWQAWQAAPERTGSALSLALLAIGTARGESERSLRVNVVWSGPSGSKERPRRTAAVVQELVDEAQDELWVVAFAATPVQEVDRALLRAVERDVRVRLVLETVASSAGYLKFDRAQELLKLLGGHASIYHWPLGKREPDDKGQVGLLHAKCVVVDERRLLISSANLTRSALTKNMELGLVVDSAEVAGRVARHWHALVKRGCLARVEEELG